MALQPRELETTTREHLIDVAESLFLSQGVDQVSLRAIAREAGQKNPSALQYHFGNREGLIDAIAARRLLQQEARRAMLLEDALKQGETISLREVCSVMVGASFLLCREDTSFRDVLGGLGLQRLTKVSDYFTLELSQEAPSLLALWELGRQALDHLPAELLALRMENAYGAGLLAMSRRAYSKESFRGRGAELFFNNLVDQVTAMLQAPVSRETRAGM
jgi:AcrR family transcriptional regulator